MNFPKEDALESWDDAVGLTIAEILYNFMDRYDDPASITVIVFNNGKYIIQRDQSYYTTFCGIIKPYDIDRYADEIKDASA